MSRLREAQVTGLEESERLLALLNTLRGISEEKTGGMQLTLSKNQVADLCTQLLDFYGDVVEDKRLRVTRAASPSLAITADRNRILQILANLLDHAMQYTWHGIWAQSGESHCRSPPWHGHCRQG